MGYTSEDIKQYHINIEKHRLRMINEAMEVFLPSKCKKRLKLINKLLANKK